MMTEIEKLDAGLPFDIFDPAVNARKLHAVKMTEALNAVPVTDHEKRVQAIRNLFGSVGNNPEILPGFHCDNGSNIHAGDDFLANWCFAREVRRNTENSDKGVAGRCD